MDMARAQLLATGSYLPGDPITNEELAQLAGELPEEILEGIQVETRHWMADPETGAHSELNSEIATKAIREALELAGIEPAEVDFLAVSTGSPDYLLPPMATFIQENLGLRKCATLEVRSGCAGAVEALDVARMYIENGQYKTAVVVGTETISPLLVPLLRDGGAKKLRMRDRIGVYSFGDGAAAMVLRAGDGDEGLFGSAVACVGGEHKPGMQIVGGGTATPLHEQQAAKRLVELKVDVVESGRFTPYVLTEALADMAAASGVRSADVDMCVIPEGNAGYMTDELREAGLLTDDWLALEPKIFENLGIVGATGSAALPLAIDYAWKTGAVKQGDMVWLLAIETSKWKYAGIATPWTAAPCPEGAGLSQQVPVAAG
jgi:3-oxoacyl-[acyl-carrier-protein] synthase III